VFWNGTGQLLNAQYLSSFENRKSAFHLLDPGRNDRLAGSATILPVEVIPALPEKTYAEKACSYFPGLDGCCENLAAGNERARLIFTVHWNRLPS